MKRTGWLCLLLGLVWVPTTRLAISAPAGPGLARSELTPTATAVDANPFTLILDPTAEFGGRVVISEIMYHPISERVSDEYIELRNLTSQPINLTGWRLSKGVDFTFPAVTLPADGYWVVAANASAFATNFPEVTNVIGDWTGVLSNTGEEIRLEDPLGETVNAVTYADEGDWAVRRRGPLDSNHRGWEWFSGADGFGKSLELMNPGLPNLYGQNWADSLTANGTPGRANSTANTNIAPLILDLVHSPLVPRAGTPITITARLLDESPAGITATVFWRRDGAATFNADPMLDDGRHNDGGAGDGVYGAILPAQTNNVILEFYAQASDATGNTRTWPAAALSEKGVPSQQANALLQVDNSLYTGPQPVRRLVLREVERAELLQINSGDAQSNAEMNGTFIAVDNMGAEARYLTGIRIRGAGSRGRVPPNNRVRIPSDRPWNGVTALNLNSQYVHSQLVGGILARKSGLHSEEGYLVQMRLNNVNPASSSSPQYGSFIQLEVPGAEFAQNHFPTDPNGNLYRASSSSHSTSLAYQGTNPAPYLAVGYTKPSNASENDWSDLVHLTDVLNNVPNSNYISAVRQVVNVQQWMTYFAVFTLTESQETSLGTGIGDDFGMYRGVNDPRFQLLAHDWDTILGEGDTGGDISAGLFRATALPSINRFLKAPEFVPLYYAELLRLLNTTFSAPDVKRVLQENLGTIVPASTINNMAAFSIARNNFVLTQIPLALTVTTTLSLSNGVARATNATVSLKGRANVLNTRSILVNGLPATWSAWEGNWSLNNVPLLPGFNSILVQARDANGAEVGRATRDIWYDTKAATQVPSPLPDNAVWTAAAGPYSVTNLLTVPAGSTLTIEAGTTVYFAPGTGLILRGRLVAEGSETRRIRFTRAPGPGETTNTWSGLRFLDSTTSNVLAFVDIQSTGSDGPSFLLTRSTLEANGLTFSATTQPVLELDHSSLRMRNSVFPNLIGAEAIRGGPIPPDGFVVIEQNIFGGTTGGHDIIAFSGARRPGPILQVFDNVFTAASDDVLDLDGTDAHVEGNLFLHVHKANSAPGDTANAISLGTSGGYAPHVVAVRNLFYDVDHAALVKEGGFLTLINNTMAGVGLGLVNFSEPERGILAGAGAYLDGNIYWNPEGYAGVNFENRFPNNGEVVLTLNRSILFGADGLTNGFGNVRADPRFANLGTNATWPTLRSNLQLRAGSPGLGSGPNGLDRGALVPAGASIAGEPLSPTQLTAATLTIGGPGITDYRYRLNGGDLSPSPMPVTQPILLNKLPPGRYLVEVIGRNSAGVWQSSPTLSRAWEVTSNPPPIRLNEILASNHSIANQGETFPDLIELANDSDATVDLSGLRLTDDPLDPGKFTFPPGTTIEARSYLVLVASKPDATPGWHTGFSLRQEGETIYLIDRAAHGYQVLDSVSFGLQLTDLSIGRLDGGGWGLTQPTFGSANQPAAVGDPTRLRLNEWLTAERSGFASDFVELYNPEPLPVPLGELSLSDNPIDWPARSPIAPLSFIAPRGWQTFQADGQTTAGADHLSFTLKSDQGMIGLWHATAGLIDCVIYGPQKAEISQGRSPDGTPGVVLFTRPTPGGANPVIPIEPPAQAINLLPMQTTWLYDDSGTNLGTAWRERAFDDSGWRSGAAPLGIMRPGGTLPTPPVTPLTLGADRITFNFRTHFSISNGLVPDGLQITHLIDDGAVVYLNGTEIYRYNLSATAAIGNLSRASVNILDATYLGPVRVPADKVLPGDNLLAVEVHQVNGASADVLFALNLDVLVVTNQARLVLLNEVLANNRSLAEPDGSTPDWIELYNTSASQADLSGFSLTDAIDAPQKWIFPRGVTVPPRGYLRVRCDSKAPASAMNTGFGLKANGGTVYLFGPPDRGNAPLDAISFGWQTPDLSIGRVPDGTANWNLNLPTPMSANLSAALGDPSRVRINEWMAAPSSGEDWFELHNPEAQPIALGGGFLTDDRAQPTQHQIPALSFLGASTNSYLVLIADGKAATGGDHVSFKLAGGGESILLYSAEGVLIDSVGFLGQETGVSEGRFPDDAPQVTAFRNTASPGEANYLPLMGIVINEVLTHTGAPLEDAIELRNITGSPVDIGGWFLSDARSKPEKFQIPRGTILPAQGFAVFYEAQFNPAPGRDPLSFSLSSAHGDEVHLSTADETGKLTGHRTSIAFGPAENGVPFGRYLTSVGEDFVAMAARTFGQDAPGTLEEFRTGAGAPNSGPKVGPIVMTEIMYHPAEVGGVENPEDEYLELRNITGQPVPLFDPNFPTNTWRLRGGVDFEFPSGLVLTPRETLLLVSFPPDTDTAKTASFRAKYQVASSVRITGPYRGKLDNGGEALELRRPEPPQAGTGEVPYVLVERIHYADTAPWPAGADATGASLQRIDEAAYGNDPINWRASPPNPGAGGNLNTAPVMDAIDDPTVDELRLFSFTATAQDSDKPDQQLVFSLEPGAPAGARISPEGVFRWRPLEAHGGNSFPITLRVTDNGAPAQSTTRTFRVRVNEVNRAPYFLDTRERYVNAGGQIRFATASDTDLPLQILSFRLEDGAPTGLDLDPSSGVLTYRPPPDATPGLARATVHVTDDGQPPLSATHTYVFHVVGSEETLILVDLFLTAQGIELRWQATPGKTYQVDSKQSLTDPAWVPLSAPFKVETENGSVAFPRPGPNFFRVRQLD